MSQPTTGWQEMPEGYASSRRGRLHVPERMRHCVGGEAVETHCLRSCPEWHVPLGNSEENTMALQQAIDALLQGAVNHGDVPGVVAAATNRNETIYEGGFGERVLGSGPAMTPDTVVWI